MKTVPHIYESKPSDNDTNPSLGTALAGLATILPGSRLKNSVSIAHKIPPDNPDIQESPPSPDVNDSPPRGLRLENLRFSYGNHQTLGILDFTSPVGRISVLIG